MGWKDVYKPVSQGGLDISLLVVSNRALLNKWLWRFRVERNTSWRRLVATKYGKTQAIWTSDTPKGVIGYGVWANISKGGDEFLRFVRFRINNGERVRFWHDP